MIWIVQLGKFTISTIAIKLQIQIKSIDNKRINHGWPYVKSLIRLVHPNYYGIATWAVICFCTKKLHDLNYEITYIGCWVDIIIQLGITIRIFQFSKFKYNSHKVCNNSMY
jgi:hypothetical protein